MVCANTPILRSFESLKEEALKHFITSKNALIEPSTIVIVDSNNQSSLLSIPALSEFEFKFVNSVHYLLRTGIYQYHNLFVISDNCSEVSRDGLEELLNIRKQHPFMVFGESQLQEMTYSDFKSLVSQLVTESRIQNTISHLTVIRGNLSSSNYKTKDRNIIHDTETSLKEYLRSQIRAQDGKPEEILKEAINLIRPKK